ncbi:RNA-binding protein 47-like isoform X1 [Cloeon dipterum]|uniref:RNA-binding protein 47-like isoform X1 n=1 Tax=Cloeon dipterum TaxID=197152 RepID=UPI00321F882D
MQHERSRRPRGAQREAAGAAAARSSRGDDDLPHRLLQLIDRTGYKMVQENGQRRYGGPCPGWEDHPPPPAEAELYVSRIPPHCFEDVLVPLFESFGKLYEVRMMLDFDGSHRGFAYVKFCNPQDAQAAITALDKYQIEGCSSRGGIRVSASRNNCEVEVSNMPSTAQRECLEPLVKEHTEGVRAVRWTCATRAILEYDNHRAAAVARRKLLAILPDQCGREVRVQLVRRDRPSNVPRQRLQMPPFVSFNRTPPQSQNTAALPTESAEEYWARKRALKAAAAGGVPPQQRSPWPLVPVASPSFGFQPLFWPPQM